MVYSMAWRLGCSSPRACIMTFATSYISLIYYTRTLSNTVEAFLFVLLMNVVVSYWSAVSEGNGIMRLFRGSNQKINNGTNSKVRGSFDNQKSKVKSGKGRKCDESNNSKSTSTEKRSGEKCDQNEADNAGKNKSSDNRCRVRNSSGQIPHQMISMYVAAISLILVVGIFNRPTFPIFVAVPCAVFMLCDRSHHKSYGSWIKTCIFKVFKMSAWVSVSSIIIILCDSFYYGSISTKDFDHLLQNVNYLNTIVMKATVAPLNFFKYNVNPENLAEHGLHSRFQHLLVNTPLLFGILAVFPIFSICKLVYKRFSKIPEDQNQRTISGKPYKLQFLILTYVVPIVLLSYFPHQEPRFLIPLLCPIALLYGHHLFDIQFKWYIALFWVVFNIFLCGLFYGALHQGGLIPSIYKVRDRILKEPYANYHVIFSHTYMPPRHLFQIPNSVSKEDIFVCDDSTFKHPKVEVHDMKGKPVNTVHRKVSWILQDRNPLENVKIFVIAPSSLDKHFCTSVTSGGTKVEYQLVMSFVPQVTTEDPPDFVNDVFNCVNPSKSQFCNWMCNNSVFDRLTFALSLNLYSVVIPAT